MSIRARRLLVSAGILLCAFAGAAQASDWVEDGTSVMPPVAPQRNLSQPPESRHLAQGGFLTGSASMVGSASAAVRVPPRLAPNPMQQEEQAGADTDRFLMNARTDSVVPPDSLKGWLQRTHPEFNLDAQFNPDAVLEIKGAWDNSSQILKAMGIRYHEMKAKELRDFPLSNNVKVMVINCEGKLPAEAIEPVRQWVIHGGYLISTDWTLHSFLERAFPGMVAWNGANTKGTTVDAMLLPTDPALLAGTQVARGTWKLDEQSQEVRILRPGAVRVLARSFKLAQSDPNRQLCGDPTQSGILACEFNYGRGKVLHLVGHFDYNSGLGFLRYLLPDAIPGAGIGLRQAIATNFLLEALEHTGRAPQ